MANSVIGLVADYGSSSDNDSDAEKTEQLESSLMNKAAITSKIPSVNFFESAPDEDDSDDESPSTSAVSKGSKKKLHKKILANPLRNDSFTSSLVDSASSVFYNPFKKEQEAKKLVLEKHVKLTTNPKDILEINGKKICWNYRKGRCKFGHKCKYAHDSDLIGAVPTQNMQNTPSKDAYGIFIDELAPEEPKEIRKRKPGLAEGLVPNKHSRKVYKEIQSKETPWLNKR